MDVYAGLVAVFALAPSMKALPKRKGNDGVPGAGIMQTRALNESPSKKEGKLHNHHSKHEHSRRPSMKALPKRKGNPDYRRLLLPILRPQ